MAGDVDRAGFKNTATAAATASPATPSQRTWTCEAGEFPRKINGAMAIVVVVARTDPAAPCVNSIRPRCRLGSTVQTTSENDTLLIPDVAPIAAVDTNSETAAAEWSMDANIALHATSRAMIDEAAARTRCLRSRHQCRIAGDAELPMIVPTLKIGNRNAAIHPKPR